MLTIRVYDNYNLMALQDLDTDLVDDATIRMFTIRLTFYSKTSNQKVSLIVRYSDFDIKTCF